MEEIGQFRKARELPVELFLESTKNRRRKNNSFFSACFILGNYTTLTKSIIGISR
jgi:hypothetical protein